MRNKNRRKIKELLFEKLVMLFGLEKAERVFKMFDKKSFKP